MPLSLDTLPIDLLQHILRLLIDDAPGPPHQLIPFLLISPLIYHRLLPIFPAIHQDIFAIKFDLSAPLRRFHPQINSFGIADELILRFRLLRRARNLNAVADLVFLEKLFWKAYLMLLENDGHNAVQLLQYARIDVLVHQWVLAQVPDNRGYLSETTIFSLALHLFSRMLHPDTTRGPVARSDFSTPNRFASIALAVFKYASAYIPEVHYHPPTSSRMSIQDETFVHSYPVYRPMVDYKSANGGEIASVHHFGLTLHPTPPLAAHSAVRIQVLYHDHFVPNPNPTTPRTRAERDQTGAIMASLEDLDDHNRYANTPFISLFPDDPNFLPSQRFDEDMHRTLWCGNISDSPYPSTAAAYKLGSLTGRWEGRVNYPFVIDYMQWKQGAFYQPVSSMFFPFNAIFQEWYSPSDGEDHIFRPGPGDNFRFAYTSPNLKTLQCKDQLVVSIGDQQYTYKKYEPGQALVHENDDCTWCVDLDRHQQSPSPSSTPPHINAFVPSDPDCPKYGDIFITGTTDPTQARAWGDFEYYGRIRQYDGLIVLVQKPLRGNDASRVFRGYMTADKTFVGRWSGPGTDTYAPSDLEGSFISHRRPAT